MRKREKLKSCDFKPLESKFIESIKDTEITEDLSNFDENFFEKDRNNYIYEINFPLSSEIPFIWSNSFKNLHLYSISFPPSVTSILQGALQGCSKLSRITFLKDENNKSSLRHICDDAFSDTSIQFIAIPSSILDIGSFCFPKTLTRIEFDDGAPKLRRIGDNAFSHTQIQSIHLPSRIQNLHNAKNVFHNCKQLTQINFDEISPQELSSIPETEIEQRKQNKIQSFQDSDLDTYNEISQDFAKSCLISQTKVQKLEISSHELNYYYFYNTPSLFFIQILNEETSKYIKIDKCIYTKDKKKLIIAEKSAENVHIDPNCLYIMNYALSSRNISRVTIDNKSKLEEISFLAFYQSPIKEIALPNTVNLIGYAAFFDCCKLGKLSIPQSLVFIDLFTFSLTTITQISIPKNVKRILYGSFYKCINLSKVEFEPNSQCIEIDDCAFACTNLVSIIIPKTVKRIGNYCFSRCPKLSSLKFENLSNIESFGLHIIDISPIKESDIQPILTHFFTLNCIVNLPFMYDKLTMIEIPAKVEEISNDAFRNCRFLTKVSITDPSSSRLSKIGHNAFNNCTSLVQFDIPLKVSYFGSSSFANCSKYTQSIRNECGLSGLYIGHSAFANSSIVSFESSTPILEISESAFENCPTLKSFSVTNTKECRIGAKAFLNCTKLDTIELGTDLLRCSLGKECFMKTAIESFSFVEADVTSIPDSCFKDCRKLREVTIPNLSCIQEFGKEAFSNTAISTVFIPARTQFISDKCFENCKNLKSISFHEDFADKMHYFCQIAHDAFLNSGLKNPVLPAAVTYSDDDYNPAKLQQIAENKLKMHSAIFDTNIILLKGHSYTQFILDHQIKYQNDIAIYGTKIVGCNFSIEKVCIPRNITKLTGFIYSQLRKITFEPRSQLRKIGHDTFNNLLIEEITIPDSVLVISDRAFYNCTKLSKVTISTNSKLKTIADYAFKNCAIESILFPQTFEQCGTDAFRHCCCLKRVENKSTNHLVIGCGAFANTPIELFDFSPKTVFMNDCFRSCYNLKQITFLSEPIDLSFDDNSFAFSGITSINLYCKATLADSSFGNCHNLSEVNLQGKDIIFNENPFINSNPKKVFLDVTIRLRKEPPDTIGSGHFLKEVIFQEILTHPLEQLDVKLLPKFINIFNKEISYKEIHIRYFDNCLYYEGVLCETNIIDNSYLYQEEKASDSIKRKKISISPRTKSLNCDFPCHIQVINFGTNSSIQDIGRFSYSCLTEITIPKCVTEIVSFAFDHCQQLRTVLFENNSQVTSIGDYAFSNTSVNEIILPDSIQQIGKYAFSYTPNLQKVEFHGQTISDNAFLNSGITAFHLSNQTKKIGAHAFEYCKNLKEFNIDISKSRLESIGEYAFHSTAIENINIPTEITCLFPFTFSNCANLKTVTISNETKLIEIDECCFSGAVSLVSINLPTSIEFISSDAFLCTPSLITIMSASNENYQVLDKNEIYVKNDKTTSSLLFVPRNLTTYSIKEHCNTICSSAFSASQITTVDFPITLEAINEGAFAHSHITKVVFPKSIQIIKDDAFLHCENLEEVSFDSQCALQNIPKYCFAFSGLKRITLPETIQVIEEFGFYFCSNLDHIDLFNTNVTYIGVSAFAATSITRLVVPPTTKFICDSAFAHTPLSTVDFSFCHNVLDWSDQPKVPHKAKKTSKYSLIPTYYFRQFQKTYLSLKQISSQIPLDEKDIQCTVHENAFVNVSSSFKFNKSSIHWPAFLDRCQSISTFIVNPYLSMKLKKTNRELRDPYSHVGDLYRIKEFTFLYDDFSNCICFMDFLSTSHIAQIDISNTNIECIPTTAFRSSNIVSIHLPSSVQNIEMCAFASCGRLQNVIFPHDSQLQQLGKFSFYGCKQLKSIQLPDAVTTISERCFALSGLETFRIPESVTEIGPYAFYRSNLTTISFNSQLKTICSYAFAFNEHLRHIDLPKYLKRICYCAFYCCSDLTTVSIPPDSYLTRIDGNAFAYAPIEELKLNSNVLLSNKTYLLNTLPKLKRVLLSDENDSFKITDDGILIYFDTSSKADLLFVPKNLTHIKISISCEELNISLPVFQGMQIDTLECQPGIEQVIFEKGQHCLYPDIKNFIVPAFPNCYSDLFSIQSLQYVEFDQSREFDITREAFMYCTHLKKIILPKCSNIGISAFAYCTNLETVICASKPIEIEPRAFFNCSSLTEFKCNVQNYIKEEAFMNCTKLKTVTLTCNEISEKFRIGISAFNGCKSLETFEFNKPYELSPCVFKDCVNLKTLDIPVSDVLRFPPSVFNNCTSLEHIEFDYQNFVNEISFGHESFKNCSSLQELIIDSGYPYTQKDTNRNKSLQSIHIDAFYNCIKLNHLRIFDGTIECVDYNAFRNCPSLTLLDIRSSKIVDCPSMLLNTSVFKEWNDNLIINLFDTRTNKHKTFKSDDIHIVKEFTRRHFCTKQKKSQPFALHFPELESRPIELKTISQMADENVKYMHALCHREKENGSSRWRDSASRLYRFGLLRSSRRRIHHMISSSSTLSDIEEEDFD